MGRKKASSTSDEAADKETNETKSFDVLMTQLESVVTQLEEGELPLERSLKAFEQGIALARDGQKILDTAEKKVELLLEDGTKKPFEAAGDM